MATMFSSFLRQITDLMYKVPKDTLDIRIAVRPADIMPTDRGSLWLADISINPAHQVLFNGD